jgi:hypothetical protein
MRSQPGRAELTVRPSIISILPEHNAMGWGARDSSSAEQNEWNSGRQVSVQAAGDSGWQ